MPVNTMVSAPPAASLTHRLQSVDSVCLAPSECIQAEPLSPALVLLSTGLLTVLLAVTLVQLRKAHSILAEERERTESERDAFAAFARRIASIDTSPRPAATGASGGVTPLAVSGSDDRLGEVKESYRETVMSMAHYDEEYGETLKRNMSGEFGEDVAVAVCEGSMFTPQLQQALIDQSQLARDRRDRFLDRLGRETDEVSTAQQTADRIESSLEALNERSLHDRSYSELIELWDTLGQFRSDVESLMRDRQQALQRNGNPLDPEKAIQPYLYRSLDVTYPVLDTGISLVEEIRQARRRVLRALMSRG